MCTLTKNRLLCGVCVFTTFEQHITTACSTDLNRAVRERGSVTANDSGLECDSTDTSADLSTRACCGRGVLEKST